MIPIRKVLESALRSALQTRRFSQSSTELVQTNSSQVWKQCGNDFRNLFSVTGTETFREPQRTNNVVSEFASPWRTNLQMPLFSASPCPLPTQQCPFVDHGVRGVIRSPGYGGSTPMIRELPSIWNIEKLDPLPESQLPLEAPTVGVFKIEKHAARLIRIRKSKMNKHQYKKLKKRMGRTWEKYRTRRKVRRIKAFLAEQELILKKAQEFDPEIYVRNFIATAKECARKQEEILEQNKEKHRKKH